MKPNLILMGLAAAVLVIFACAILSSAFTLVGLDMALSSGLVEKKIVSGGMAELSKLTIDCNQTQIENALVVKLEGLTLYCSIA